jgi:hypothetical protein
MGTPIVTPFGQFPTQIAAARHIYRAGYKPAFDAAFPPSQWPRQNWGTRYEEQRLDKNEQDICDVIRLLMKKEVPGWGRYTEAVVQPRVEHQAIGIPARMGIANPLEMRNSV